MPPRHRGLPKRRQVDAVQRADTRGNSGREPRSARSTRTSASSRCRIRASPRSRRSRSPRRSCRPRSSSWTSRDSSPVLLRAKGSATNSWRTSARWTRSRTSCAASMTLTSCTFPGGWTRRPTLPSSTPSSRSPTSRPWTARANAPRNPLRPWTRTQCAGVTRSSGSARASTRASRSARSRSIHSSGSGSASFRS